MLVYDSAILVKSKRSTSQAKYSSSTATARLSNHSSTTSFDITIPLWEKNLPNCSGQPEQERWLE